MSSADVVDPAVIARAVRLAELHSMDPGVLITRALDLLEPKLRLRRAIRPQMPRRAAPPEHLRPADATMAEAWLKGWRAGWDHVTTRSSVSLFIKCPFLPHPRHSSPPPVSEENQRKADVWIEAFKLGVAANRRRQEMKLERKNT